MFFEQSFKRKLIKSAICIGIALAMIGGSAVKARFYSIASENHKEILNDVRQESGKEQEEKKSAHTRSEDKEKFDMEKVELTRVVDGDTIEVKNNNGETLRVRMIGMDTPDCDEESNLEYGEPAKSYTEKVLKNVKNVYLEYTEKKNDTYGRTLAYVWKKDTKKRDNKTIKKYCLNAKLVAQGYARPYFEQDNTYYRKEFRKYYKQAKKQKRGLFEQANESSIWK